MNAVIPLMMSLFVAAMIGGMMLWYQAKKKEIAGAQEIWARAVQRLGGHELPQKGIAGTRVFTCGQAVLKMMTFAALDTNIQHQVEPIGAPNTWQSQVIVAAQRGLPAFEIRWGRGRGVPTGNAGFDADWSVIPLQGCDPRAVIGLLDEQVMAALHTLRGRPYQIYSGGYNVYGLLAGILPSEREVEALLFICRRIAGTV